MGERTSKLLVALAVGLAAMLLVFILARTTDPADQPDVQSIVYMVGVLILVSAGNWALLRRMSLATYLRNVGIWIVIGAAAFGLYYLVYPDGR